MAGKRGAARTAALPPVTVARFTEATALVERLIQEKADVFLRAQQAYRERHAAFHPERDLTAQEAAQIAAAMITAGDGQDPVELAERIQQSELRAQDRPAPEEMLAVAGVSTAPEFINVGVRLLALLRIPADDFKAARKAGTLDERIREEVEPLEDLDMLDARELALEAFKHYGLAGGAEGNGLSLIGRIVRQALEMAMGTMGPALDRLTSASLTGSPPSTDGRSTTFSTTSPTPTPGS